MLESLLPEAWLIGMASYHLATACITLGRGLVILFQLLQTRWLVYLLSLMTLPLSSGSALLMLDAFLVLLLLIFVITLLK